MSQRWRISDAHSLCLIRTEDGQSDADHITGFLNPVDDYKKCHHNRQELERLVEILNREGWPNTSYWTDDNQRIMNA